LRLRADLNCAHLSSARLGPAVRTALQPSLSKNSFGLALQFGLDYQFMEDTSFNADVKNVQIRTNVSSAGTKVGTFDGGPAADRHRPPFLIGPRRAGRAR